MKNILCWLFDHNFHPCKTYKVYLSENMTYYRRDYFCERCGTKMI